jgi:alpha-beta hydrolase superfamily lysophospholipase
VNKYRILNWLKIILILYALVGTALYMLQDRLLFHPVAVDRDSSYAFKQPYKELSFPLDASNQFHIVQFTVPDSIRKGIVLYFHGNKTNISRYAKFSENFTRNKYDVWMMDYPGFGKSTGTLSEDIVYEEALQLYKLARVRYKPEQIIIYGKSIGTGVAAQLASVRDCRRLILETPYYGLAALVNNYLWMYPVERMIHFKLPTYQYMSKVTAPVTIFHGTDDELISFKNASKLQSLLKPGDEFIAVENGRHNNLFSFKLVQEKLDSVLQK